MKILIISPPRCGSTSLLNSISVLRNAERIAEPYTNPEELISRDPYTYPLSLSKNCVVKMITRQVPIDYGTPDDFVEFILSIYNLYDRVILISRKNFKDHFESYVNLKLKLNKEDVHAPWYIEDIKKYIDSISKTDFRKFITPISKLSKNLSIPITYYEDLYSLDRNKSYKILENLNIDLNYHKLNYLLNPRFKYRQSSKKNIL